MEEIEDIPQFAKRIKSRYPDYNDVDDFDLVERVVRKHPTYASQIKLPENFRLLQTTSGYQKIDDLYESIGREEGVDPNLLLEQGRKETAFKPENFYGTNKSSAGAVGAGQFMSGTAPKYGLKVENGVDDRTDPVKSIRAQAKYMKKLLGDFDGNEDLALAGYNAGEYRPKTLGKGVVPPIPETQDYVKTIRGNLTKLRSQSGTLRNLIGATPASPPAPNTIPTLSPTETYAQPFGANLEDTRKGGKAVYIPPPTNPVNIAPEVSPIVLPPTIPTGLQPQDETDLAELGQQQVGQTNFGANYQPTAPALPPDYLAYLKARELPDSQDLRNEYSRTLKDEQGAYDNSPVKNPIAQLPAAPRDSRRTMPTAEPSAPKTVLSQDAPTVLKAGTYDNLRQSENSGQRISIDLSNVSSDKNAYINTETAKQIAAQFDVPEADALEVLSKYPQMHGDGTAYTPEEVQAQTSANFKITPKLIEEIRRTADSRNVEKQRAAALEKQLLETAQADDDLFAQAKQQLIDERNDHNIISGADGLGSYVGDKIGQMFTGAPPEPTQAEILDRFEEIKKSRLSNEATARAVEVGQRNEQSFGGQLLGGLYGATGRTMQAAAGIMRPLASLGIEKPYEFLSKTGAEMQLSGQTSNGNSWSGTAADLAAGLPIDLLRLSVLSRIPGGAVIGFAADAGLQSAGRGDNLRQIEKQGTKGAAIGALFPVSSVVGKAVGGASSVFETVARLGTIGAGTTGIELASGTPIDKALQSGLMNVLFDAAPIVGAKLFGKVGRIWQKGTAHEVSIDDAGNVSLVRFKDQANPNRVDFEMVLDPIDGVYKDAGEVGVNRGKQIGSGTPAEEFGANQAGNVPNNDVAGYNRTPNSLETSAPPRELSATNPRRIEAAAPEAVQKAALDTRAQKIVENLKDGKTYTVEQLQRTTKYNKNNVEETLLTLFAARRIEILPDNSVRFIGGNDSAIAAKSLFDRAAEITAPKENVNLPKSSVESEIYSSDSTPEPLAVKQPSSENGRQTSALETKNGSQNDVPSNEKVDDLSIYEALPNAETQINADSRIALDSPEAHRQTGQFTKDGTEYVRQDESVTLDAPKGATGKVQFAGDADTDFTYQLIEADALQPSHLGGNRNYNHFVPEMQPKRASNADRKIASDRIAQSPDFGKLGNSPNAYSGAPVVNTRGEAVQGNNRSEGLIKHYKNGGTEYKRNLAAQAGNFGFTAQDVNAMKSPVLVRTVKESDDAAIKLGNYTAQDIETGGTRRIEAQNTAARIPVADRLKIINDIFGAGEKDLSLNEHIRENQGKILKNLSPFLTDTQRISLLDNQGKSFTPEAVGDVEKLVTHFLFDGGVADLPQVFESLPHYIKRGTTASFPAIFSTAPEKSLIPEIQNAALATQAYREQSAESNLSFDDWARQADLFSNSTPQDTFTRAELALSKKLLNAGTQSEIKQLFKEYAKMVSGRPATMFEPKTDGLSKADAVRELLGVEYENPDEIFRSQNRESGQTTDRQARNTEEEGRTENGESGQDRLDAPQFAVAGENVAPRTIKERIFAGRVKKLAENAPITDVLIAKAKFESRGDVVLLNPEATEYVRQVIGRMFGESQPAFLGGYLKPEHIEMFSKYLENDLGKSGLRPFAVNKAAKLLQTIIGSADKIHNDSVILSNSPEFPDGLPMAKQEEFAHRADARTRGAIDPALILDNPAARKAADYLKNNLYNDVSDASLAQEVIAKAFRADAETELNLTKDEVEEIRFDYAALLVENGVEPESVIAFENISESGKEFAENVRRKEQTNLGEYGRGRTRGIDVADGSYQAARETGRQNRPETLERNPDRFARLRQAENLGADRNGNQSLAVRTRNEILYSRPSETKIDPEEVKTEAEKATKTLMSYIYDGKRDVSPTEAAMNIMRTGYLAGLSVIKTNVIGNTSNIVIEQLAKPLMATADILNPKAKTRTTPGLSARDVVQGFFGKDGFFRAGFTGDKGVLTALIKGVDHQESARVDMNIADKNTNFVRNTGVPLIDVIIEATKRVVTGVDRPFKAYARSSEKSGLARLEASKEKLSGLEWRRRMNELRDSPTAYINDAAERYAEVVTFQNPNAVTAAYDKFRKFLIDEKAQSRIIPTATQRKIAKYVGSAGYLATGQVAPFLSTPSNVGFRTLEYFFPTGVVAAAFKFHRIGQSFERQNFIEEQGLSRAKTVKRLAAIRALQDGKFTAETNAKKQRLDTQKKQRNAAFKSEIEAVKNSKVLTAAAGDARIEQLQASREKWLESWEKNLEKYLEGRSGAADKATAQRKVVDDIQRKEWESEDAYADLKFSAFENRAFNEAAGRAGFGATVGSLALLGVIYGLIKAVGTTDYDDESAKSKQKRASGIPDDSVSIGGYRFPYADNPFGNALKMGINLFEQYERPGGKLDRAGAMAKRFGKDVTSLNPLTAQEFTRKDWSSWAGSKANSMTPLLNLKILQEIGEVADDKPRKYWEEGFAAQYLIKIPKLRENLPESESFIGGEEERGDIRRRALRAIDPLKTTRENLSQDDLPVTPLSKDRAADSSDDKKLDEKVRRGKMTQEEATKVLTDDVNRGDISLKQAKERMAALSESKSVKQLVDAGASGEQDFTNIERILKNAAPEDRNMLEKVLVDKINGKSKSPNNKSIADRQKLLEIHGKYFAPK